jgi:hypothetical protein
VANWELQLIAKILEDGDLDTATRLHGLDTAAFDSGEAAMIFEEIFRFYHDRKHYGVVPPRSWIEERYPSTDLPSPESEMEVLCEIVKGDFTRTRLMNYAEALYNLAQSCDEPKEAVEFMLQRTSELSKTHAPGEDMDFGDTALEAIEREIKILKDKRGLLGLPWAWRKMNDETQGIGLGLTVLYGRPKSMKTWVMICQAAKLYVNHGIRTLIWCREMSPVDLRRRLAMVVGKVSAKRFRQGTMSDEEEDTLLMNLEMVRDDEATGRGQKLVIVRGTQGSSAGAMASLAELRGKVDQYQPQVIFADSPYHMQASMKWEDVMALCVGMNDISLDYKVPFITTWQANREGAKTKGKGAELTDVALGDALGREAALLIRSNMFELPDNEDPDKERTLISLAVSGAREFAFDGITIHGNPGGNFDHYKDGLIWEHPEAGTGEQSPASKRNVKGKKAIATRTTKRKPVDEWPDEPDD